MVYSNFEQIPVWQESRRFIGQIYRLTDHNFKHDYDLMKQLRRASLSIALNIAEGFERKTNKDFARFINMAKGSSGECRATLYIAHDLGYISDEIVRDLLDQITSISQQLSKFSEFLIKTPRIR